jgi:hypothetical protein
VRGVELGDCGVHVVEIEPHLQRDSTVVVEAEQLEQLVSRRPRAHICSADFQSSERQTMPSHSDNDVTVPHRIDRGINSCAPNPFVGRKFIPGHSDYLSAAFDDHGRCDLFLELTPSLAIERGI